MQKVEKPRIGDIAIWFFEGDFGLPGETVDVSGMFAHSAIYAGTNRSKEKEYITVLKPFGERSAPSESEILTYNQATLRKYEDAGWIVPQINSEPLFFHSPEKVE